MVLIEQVLFDAPAAIQALQPHAVGWLKRWIWDKGRFAGELGLYHRIAQQQLAVMTWWWSSSRFFIVNQDLAAQPPPDASTQ